MESELNDDYSIEEAESDPAEPDDFDAEPEDIFADDDSFDDAGLGDEF